MPKIHLKPNSPEYDDSMQPDYGNARCEMPGCNLGGDFKAPKDRSLDLYYFFCQEHITEYNKAWNFFDGMSDREVEDHIVRSATWDRPTRKFSDSNAEDLLRKARNAYNFTEEMPKSEKEKKDRYFDTHERNTPEFEALAIMGLRPPVDLAEIKDTYKKLAKRHHPDLNQNDPKAEDLLKSINMAYTILKLAYEKFGTLDPE